MQHLFLTRFKAPANFNLFLYGDDHLGTTARHKHGWEQLCHMLETSIDGLKPSANLAIDHGDIIEGIMVDDPRFDLSLHRNTPLAQAKAAVKERWEIRRHIKLILDGNHTAKTLTKFGLLVPDVVCEPLGVQYGTISAKILWTDKKGRSMFRTFHTHGSRAVNSTVDDPKKKRENMENSLKRGLMNKAGDVVLMAQGHTHKLLVSRPERELWMGDNEIVTRANYTDTSYIPGAFVDKHTRWYINTGSFLKMYVEGGNTYNERAGYDPVELGFVLVKIRNRKIVSAEKIIFGGDK